MPSLLDMLQALPGTALWFRLEKEGRLRGEGTGMNQSTLMNFEPTRPIEQIAAEYMQAFWDLYEPALFLQRCYRYALQLRSPKGKRPFKLPKWPEVRGLVQVAWLQGIQRAETRALFWRQLWGLWWKNPAGLVPYLTVCAHGEHFFEFRQEVRQQIESQLAQIRSVPQPVSVA